MKLNAKITLVLMLLATVLSAGFWWASQQQAEQRDQWFLQELHRPLASNLLKEIPLVDNGEFNYDALETIFQTLMTVNPSIEVYLLALDGRVLTYSAPYKRVQMDRVDLQPIEYFLRDEPRFPIVGDNPRDPAQRQVFSAAPVMQNDQMAGYLYVVLGGDLHQAVAGRTTWLAMWQNAGIGLLTLALFALLSGLLFWWLLSRRLRRLNQSVSEFRSALSEHSYQARPIPAEPNSGANHRVDEIAQLSNSCATMSSTILRQIEQITYTDQMRRQLVANVSHDLRTPLASLEGYLETVLMKKDQLSPAQTQAHVATAYKSARRLRQLIAELFELARLEAADREPSLELFSIAELASDVVQKLQVIAAKKQVHIKLSVQDNAHYAVAEIGLIERVLENLLVNAIEHSPEHTRVHLQISDGADDRIAVAVIDNGAGIAERELPRIFDRFYRPDHGADHRTEGAGLGLAIVKRIIDLHNTQIKAASQPGRGSVFAFWLPSKAASA
ncbi:MAG: ATP-binding protein [Pseudomonadota bacterium]